MLGKVFNQRYRLKEKIGSGGMAEVFLADDLLLERQVAVKVLHSQFATDPAFIQRFRHEAQAAANLNHPNIVSIYDWGNEGDLYYIVMEFLEGESLREVLRKSARLDVDRAMDIAIQTCQALEAAHGQGILHRDIKSDNLMIYHLYIKILNF